MNEEKQERLDLDPGQGYVDLHKKSVLFAKEVVEQNGIPDENKFIHTSYITSEDELPFELPKGRMLVVRVEIADDADER